MQRIKVLIADDMKETVDLIRKVLNIEQENFEIVGEAYNGEEVLKLIPRLKPDVVLMDINMPKLNGLEATEKITTEFPTVTVIIMSVQGENEYLRKAMLCGAKEYIVKPFNYNALLETIKVTFEKNKARSVNLVTTLDEAKNAKIITYFSSKGGVGKSVLALNSAITLSKYDEKKVLLMDMDLQFGDISMMVNKYNAKTILDVIDDGQVESFENIKPYLYGHNKNLDILFAPSKPEAVEFIGLGSIEKILKVFQESYDYIIIDTGINFSETTLHILDNSERILFVSTMEIVSLKNTKLGLQVMESLGYDKDKVKLIINKFTTSYGIDKKDVQEAFKHEIFAMIPHEENIVTPSINKGEPYSDNPKHQKLKVWKSLDTMCKQLNY
ncbi:response regulator [Alkalicella caledoniensis]|uniref:Stage 0 sporulation protein A homolog n=1 Tax=Alkalicella caledoniensis TaxID=2731377 RepID=A0A7G9W7D6_ALKCA|nr:response regulator [Alkalicella caledoniensis]QNO14598.1 response regulator [Alkalicella caledoniensis]